MALLIVSVVFALFIGAILTASYDEDKTPIL
jgi:hypothetical protein